MEKKVIRIAPSLLAADFTNLDKELNRVIKAKADWIHLDIMDGIFVDNISFGIPVCNAIKHYCIFKDVHLMISNPVKYAINFIDAGADLITFHLESLKYKKDVKNLISLIHSYDRAVGISIKPETPIEKILPYLKDIDLVLIMSVNPGFGGQKFINDVLVKIKQLRNYIDENYLDCYIEVDGGINNTNSKEIIEAGADVLVSGSYLFNGNMKENIKLLKKY